MRWRATASAIAYLSLSIPSPVTAEMRKRGSFLRLAKVVSFLSLSGLAASALEATRSVGLAASAGSKLLSSAVMTFVVGDGVGGFAVVRFGGDGGVGDVNEVDEDGGALDVFEELDAEAGAEVGAFDEAGHVGDGEGLFVGWVADLDDAEVGLEGGEGVVGDFGFGGGEARDERGFADVGEADEAGVGEQAELEAVVAGFAGAAEFVLARGLVGGGGEVLVAAAAASALGDDDFFAGMGEVVDELAGVVVVEQGADGDVEDGVLAGVAGHVGAHAVLAALGLPFGVEAEVDEGVVHAGGAHEDVAAVAAVAAGGTAAGDEFFAAEGHAAVAAVAGLDADSCFIDEHAFFAPRISLAESWRRRRDVSRHEGRCAFWGVFAKIQLRLHVGLLHSRFPNFLKMLLQRGCLESSPGHIG